ncbi:MAG: hypothetical protein D4R68_08325 [Ignavibacteriales bacterium]|nr:MAG: hypothetical protein D4R68_08325 [Ignavibacteriales bacterium]
MFNKNKIEFFFFILFSKIFKVIGLRSTRKFAKLLGSFIYYIIPIRKKIVIENLTSAFPEKSNKEIERIAKRNYQNIFLTFFEFMYYPNSNSEEIKTMLKVPNLDLMKNKMEEGKGMIFLTGHFGSWEIGGLAAALLMNYPFHVLAKPQRNPYITEWWKNTREMFGNKEIWLGVSIRQIFEVLKSNGILCVVADQRGPMDSPRVNFFGRQTAFYTGTASIILKVKCNVIMGVIIRQSDYSYKTEIEELVIDDIGKNQNDQVKEITQKYISFLEKHIRNYPEQYFWMHKIWKY